MDNYKRLYISDALYQTAFVLSSGSIMQGFLLRSGVSQSAVYSYESMISTVSGLVLLASVFFADRIQRTGRVITICHLLRIPLLAAMILASLGRWGADVYIPLLGTAVIAYICTGINNTAYYRFPYEVIDMDHYGKYTGVTGIVSGAATLLISALYSYTAEKAEFFTVHSIFSAVAVICLLLACYYIGSCKKVPQPWKTHTAGGGNRDVFKNPVMWLLLAPNFLRGISSGIVNLVAVIAAASGIISQESVAKTVIAVQLAMFAGNFLFIEALKKAKVQNVLMASGVIMGVLLPFSMSAGSEAGFFVLYFFIRLFMTILDSAIPVCVTKVIPYNQIGAFTSIRMMAMTCGTAAAPILLGFLETRFRYESVFVFAAICKLICCAAYYFAAKKKTQIG